MLNEAVYGLLSVFGGDTRSISIGANAQANATAREATATARSADGQVKELQGRVDKLLLLTAAMWSLLSEKAGVTENELLARAEQLDAADGIVDGKITTQIVACPKCGRTIAKRRSNCIFCGEPRPGDSVFETL